VLPDRRVWNRKDGPDMKAAEKGKRQRQWGPQKPVLNQMRGGKASNNAKREPTRTSRVLEHKKKKKKRGTGGSLPDTGVLVKGKDGRVADLAANSQDT